MRYLARVWNGQGGIRTHETREGLPVFKTGAFNRTATCPGAAFRNLGTRSEKSHARHACANPSEL
jgi:hypothetical protein